MNNAPRTQGPQTEAAAKSMWEHPAHGGKLLTQSVADTMWSAEQIAEQTEAAWALRQQEVTVRHDSPSDLLFISR